MNVLVHWANEYYGVLSTHEGFEIGIAIFENPPNCVVLPGPTLLACIRFMVSSMSFLISKNDSQRYRTKDRHRKSPTVKYWRLSFGIASDREPL